MPGRVLAIHESKPNNTVYNVMILLFVLHIVQVFWFVFACLALIFSVLEYGKSFLITVPDIEKIEQVIAKLISIYFFGC